MFSEHLTYLVLHFILFFIFYSVVGIGEFDMLIRSCDDDDPLFFFSIWL